MQRKNTHPKDLLRTMSEQLGLGYQPQDWGIINADGDRIDDFVAFFETRELRDCQRFQLAELILASCNERLVDSGVLDEARLLSIFRANMGAVAFHIEYWRGMTDAVEFPLGAMLRTHSFAVS